MKVKSLSCVRLLATPWTAAYQLLGPWIFQARVLEWGVIVFSEKVSPGKKGASHWLLIIIKMRTT